METNERVINIRYCYHFLAVLSHHTRFSNVYLFADDAKIFRHILCPDDQQRSHSGVVQWTQRWLLNLNIKIVKWSPLEEMSIMTVHTQC